MKQEIWKPVSGFEGYYEVSNCGRVRSLARVVKRGNHLCPVAEKVLKPIKIGPAKPYPSVKLCKDGGERVGKLHRLVAEAFLGKPPEGKRLVLHIDGDCTNNHVDNLRWGSQAENVADTARHGARTGRKTLLTLKQFIGIYYSDATLRELTDRFGVHPVYCSKLRNGHTPFPKPKRCA
jgi:hypothetical protein